MFVVPVPKAGLLRFENIFLFNTKQINLNKIIYYAYIKHKTLSQNKNDMKEIAQVASMLICLQKTTLKLLITVDR